MEWSAETALNELWSGLDTSQSNGDVRRYLKQHLEAAFDAGRNQEADTWRMVTLARKQAGVTTTTT